MRLNLLPQVMRESVMVQLSDATTEDIYKQLAAKGWLNYQKYTQRPLTEEEKAWEQQKQSLGLETPAE
jgi:Mn-dependent DtxR family transcriptional regulator